MAPVTIGTIGVHRSARSLRALEIGSAFVVVWVEVSAQS